MHKQNKKTEDTLTLNRMRDKRMGTDRKEAIGPNFGNYYLQRSLRRAKNPPTESWENWCFQAQDSGDIMKVKGLLSAELSCPGT